MNMKNSFNNKLQQTIQLLESTFTTHNPNEIFLSFNGGKDCTVLLDIIDKLLQNAEHQNYDLNCIYVRPTEPFQEIDEFVDKCEQHYNTEIRVMQGAIKEVLQRICHENPSIRACIMGSRRTDPFCEKLSSIQETDPGWPKLTRVNPLLDWNCTDIWHYIKENSVPYCSLYDRGYTSIGDKTNTIPNPYLRYVSSSGEVAYLPAYQLKDADKHERAGRI
ncbi:FAD synthase-like [Toxorhynchites rutilus septentrionalis]|uniref:FAD synthase-like n=1 Tax=Toxorhynchites rutilus septentrionalis TaxID=329112 RepID=UPI0024796BE6|nr:FAD synthase-like [Toxorhynchites rutilus septentrionalis]